jgi:ribosomal protein L37E
MTSKLSVVVRLSARQNAVLRECDGCGSIAALSRNQTHCASCTAPAAKRRRAA